MRVNGLDLKASNRAVRTLERTGVVVTGTVELKQSKGGEFGGGGMVRGELIGGGLAGGGIIGGGLAGG